MHGPGGWGRTPDEDGDEMIARRMQALLMVVLFAGSPFGPVLPERPSALHYAGWFPRSIPEHGGP